MGYYLTKRGNIINENRELIPMKEGNSLYEQYVLFLKNNGTVEETDLLSDEELEQERRASIPQTVSKMRFFLSLLNVGITRQMINDAISQIEDDFLRETVSIKLELSQDFDRYDEHLNMMASNFNISQEQLDQLFIISNS